MPLDQRWQGWPEKDPKQFFFPLGAPVTLFGYQITNAFA